MSEEAFLQVARPSSDTFVPTLVLVGTRLGTDKINPAYWDGVLASLQMPQSVGIAGLVQLPCSSYLNYLVADIRLQWPPVIVSLLCRNARQLSLLSRPSFHPSCLTISRRRRHLL
jgi:hypothetical protein